MENFIKNTAELLFNNLWIKIDFIDISQKNWIYEIKIRSNESWLIIWKNWKNYESIQNILRTFVNKNNEEKIKINLEVNDYIKTKDDFFISNIIGIIKEVELTWKDIKLKKYSPYERKKIHSIVSEYNNPKIYTKSMWEWEERRIYICKTENKLTIDIDWDNI